MTEKIPLIDVDGGFAGTLPMLLSENAHVHLAQSQFMIGPDGQLFISMKIHDHSVVDLFGGGASPYFEVYNYTIWT